MENLFRGLMPPVFTPFHEDLTLNTEIIPEYVKFLNGKNVKAILVNGTSGEGYSMSVEERKLVAEVWLREAKLFNMHVMIQVGGAPMPDVITLAKHAERIGADSILTLPELYIKPQNTDELVDYLKLVAEAAPKTPLFYYHIPMFTDLKLNMKELVSKAKKSIKNFKGLKFTSNDLKEGKEVLEECGEDYMIYLGADSMLNEALKLGFDSSIGTTFNMFTFGDDMVNSNMNGDRYQRSLNEAIETITHYGNWVQTMKPAMALLTGIKVGPPRPPLKRLTSIQIEEMGQKLSKQGFIIH